MGTREPQVRQLQSRVHQLEVLAELGQQALETNDIDHLMTDTLIAISETLNTDYCLVLERLPCGEEALIRQRLGWRDDQDKQPIVSTGPDSQLGYTLRTDEPVIVDDLRNDARFSGPEFLIHHDVVSGMSVLLGSVDDPWGVLGTYTRTRREFTEDEVTFVQRIAHILTSAITQNSREQSLKRKNKRTELALSATDATVWEWDFDRDAVTTHPDPHGLFRSSVTTGEEFLQSIHPDDRDRVERSIFDAIQLGTAYHVEYRFLVGDTVHWAQDYGEIFDPKDGNGPRMIGVAYDISERKKREQALEEYRALTEAVNDVIITIDQDGIIRTVNPAVQDMFGYDPVELQGTPLTVLMPDELSSKHQRGLERYLATGERTLDWYYTELPGKHRDGSKIELALSFSEIEFPDERFFTGVIRDITEQKEHQREFIRLLDLLTHTERTASVGSWELNATTHELFWSDQLFEIVGLPNEDEPHLSTVLEGFHRADRPQVEDAIERALTFGEPFELEARFLTPTGEVRWIRLQGVPHTNADGDVIAIRGAAQDITEQTKQERELARSVDLLRHTEEIANVGGWEIDPVSLDVFWSDRIFDLLNVPSDTEPPLETAISMYHEEDRTRVQRAVERALSLGEPIDMEVRIGTTDGDIRWLHLQGEPEIEDGQVVMLRGAAQDITERKERERALEKSHDRLEEFASAVSHDLRQPLRTVASYLQLLERRYHQNLDENAEQFIDFAVEGATRMQEMIDGLVSTYAQAETGSHSFKPIDLNAVIDGVLVDLDSKIEESNADITIDSLPTIMGDCGQLRQLFMNLVDNAIKYAGDDNPRIHISSKPDDDRWIVSVSDNGIGIDPNTTELIFNVFHRLHSDEDIPGTGLGLSLCQRIVENHGGEIWVESEPGVGSTFSVVLLAQ